MFFFGFLSKKRREFNSLNVILHLLAELSRHENMRVVRGQLCQVASHKRSASDRTPISRRLRVREAVRAGFVYNNTRGSLAPAPHDTLWGLIVPSSQRGNSNMPIPEKIENSRNALMHIRQRQFENRRNSPQKVKHPSLRIKARNRSGTSYPK